MFLVVMPQINAVLATLRVTVYRMETVEMVRSLDLYLD